MGPLISGNPVCICMISISIEKKISRIVISILELSRAHYWLAVQERKVS